MLTTFIQQQFGSDFADTIASPATTGMEAAAAETVKELSLWDLCMSGGFIMIPLALLSIVCIYIFIYLYINK